MSTELRKTAKPGYMGLGIARILEVRDKSILFDDKFVPPMLICSAHPVVDGWLNRIIGVCSGARTADAVILDFYEVL